MKTLGNVIWFIFGGLLSAFAHFIVGIVFCATLVLIPFGIQHFKIGMFVIWPFGKTVETNFDKHPAMNVLWIIFGGIGYFAKFVAGILLCLTIIGIPFARQHFKLGRLGFLPFGAEVGN